LARVRLLSLAFILIAACGGGGGAPIKNLSLRWRGVDHMPLASQSVERAFAVMPFSFALRDLRLDPTAVGILQNDNNLVVHTGDNVGQYCTDRLADMLSKAGARINLGMPGAALEAELLEYKVIEGGRFHGSAKLRLILRRGDGEPWTKTYVGSSKHWGRTHDPDKFNDVLSNALQDATSKIVGDEDFARALMGEPPAPLLQPEPRRPGG
jgi:hypothetical protein